MKLFWMELSDIWLLLIGTVTRIALLGSLPIGAPKATLTPAAEAADKISRFFASFLPGISNFEYKYQLQRKMLRQYNGNVMVAVFLSSLIFNPMIIIPYFGNM